MSENTASRTVKTVRNIGSNIISRALVSVLKLVSRVVFVAILSETMLGISGLFSGVLGMLALAELGIGTAIHFSLYQPIAENDRPRIRALMRFYQKVYRIIAGIVLALGLALIPFLPYFVHDYQGIEYFYEIYLIFLFNLVVEYLFSYKRSLATASQEGYVIVPYTMAFEVLICLLQIASLFVFAKSPYCYLIYLAVQAVSLVAENVVINRALDKKYPILKELSKKDVLPREELQGIWGNVKALLFHKIGGYVVTGTDTILISAMIDLVIEGHYSNYSSLIATIAGIVYMFVGNVTSSFGNLIVTEAPQRRREVFEEMLVFDYFLYGVGSAFFITLFSPFITLAYGEKFLLGMGVVILAVSANYYLLGMTQVLDTVKAAAGLYDADKWVPLCQAAVNLIVSMALAKAIGLAGIFIGTLVSTLLPLIAKPLIIYHRIFETAAKPFFFRFLWETALCAAYCALSYFVSTLWLPQNMLVQLVFRFAATGVVSVGLFSLFHFRDPNFRKLFWRVKGILTRK